MKKIIAIFLALVMTLSLFACGEDPRSREVREVTEEPETTNEPAAEATEEPSKYEDYVTKVISLKGPTGMGMAQLFDNANYEMTLVSPPDEATADIIAGRFDIAAVPTNLAAVLYNKTEGKVKVLGLNTMGVLYILENGETITSIKDLEGKTIGATGQGSTPEYILNYLLEKNGVNCEIVYYSEHAELMTQMVQGNVQIGMLPEPNVSTAMAKNSNIRIALDLTAEWNAVCDTTLTQGCIIVSEDYLTNHKTALAAFLEDYKNSVDFVNNNVSEAAEKIAEKGIIPSKEIAEKAIPNCNICLVTGDEMQNILKAFWQVLYEANPKSVGGKLPDEEAFA